MEIEVWLGKDECNMHKLTIKTERDIYLARQALNIKEKELKKE